MNFIFRTLLPLFFLSSSLIPSIAAMQQSIISDKISKKELISGFKELPEELKDVIISLVIQISAWNFVPYKSFPLSSSCVFMAFSPDGKDLLRGFFSECVVILNLEMEKEIRYMDAVGFISSAVFNPQGETILTGSVSGTASIINYKTGKLLQEVNANAGVYSVAFSGDGKTFLTGTKQGLVCLWDSQTGHMITPLTGNTLFLFEPQGYSPSNREIMAKGFAHGVNSFVFNQEEETILAVSNDGTISIWDSKTTDLIKEFKVSWLRKDKSFYSGFPLAFSPDGKTILTGSDKEEDNGSTCIRNSGNGELIAILKGQTPIYSAAFSSNGKTVITGAEDGTICVWDAQCGEQIQVSKEDNHLICSLAFSLDGKTIATQAYNGMLRIWKLQYDFSFLTSKQKEKLFKQFLSLKMMSRSSTPLSANKRTPDTN